MHNRRDLILSAILKYFIEDGIPVPSKKLKHDFDVSSATIRNDMAYLEKEGLITQPHRSAGRIPTEVGYRFYVDNLIESPKNKFKIKQLFLNVQESYYKRKTIEKIYDTVAIVSKMSDNIAFATIPENNKTYYMGVANILRIPEFANNIVSTSEVIEVLESGFFDILKELNIDKSIKIFIGQENMIEQIQSCSMLATEYFLNGYKGVLGILGSLRMKYAYNKAILEFGSQALNDK